MRNCSILVRQVLTIEATETAENWVGKATRLYLSSCLKAGLTRIDVPLLDAFLNCSWKILMAGGSRSLMHEQPQFSSVCFALWNTKNTL